MGSSHHEVDESKHTQTCLYLFIMLISSCYAACGWEGPQETLSRTQMIKKYGRKNGLKYFSDCQRDGGFTHDCKRYDCQKRYPNKVRISGGFCDSYEGHCWQQNARCTYASDGSIIGCAGK